MRPFFGLGTYLGHFVHVAHDDYYTKLVVLRSSRSTHHLLQAISVHGNWGRSIRRTWISMSEYSLKPSTGPLQVWVPLMITV
jgi:hypothetical protein